MSIRRLGNRVGDIIEAALRTEVQGRAVPTHVQVTVAVDTSPIVTIDAWLDPCGDVSRPATMEISIAPGPGPHAERRLHLVQTPRAPASESPRQ